MGYLVGAPVASLMLSNAEQPFTSCLQHFHTSWPKLSIRNPVGVEKELERGKVNVC